MKKQLLTLSLFATFLLPTLAPINLPAFAPEDVAIEGEIQQPRSLYPDVEFKEGGQLYLCFQGNLDQLQQTTRIPVDNNFTLASIPLNPFTSDDGNKSIAINNLKETASYIKNNENEISLINIRLRTVGSNEMGRSTTKITALESGSPYIDYVAADSEKTPCDSTRIRFGKIVLAKNTGWQVVQLSALAQEVEPAPEQAPEVAPPAAPGLQGSAAPQSGGCNMSMALGGFNFALSTFFALVLGAHALLRFRRK